MIELLRLATAGSVDDGKSTLVGRLLHDTKSVLADTLAAVERVSRDRGHDGVDLALLTDGLRAEREQGITIDVAYRYFATPHRSFVLADTPGHVQYTRNTVTGASTAELVLVLVDARKGCWSRPDGTRPSPRCCTCRTSCSRSTRWTSSTGTRRSSTPSPRSSPATPPRSASRTSPSSRSRRCAGTTSWTARRTRPWYDGPTLLGHLETVPVTREPAAEAMRLPVQVVIRPQRAADPEYRDYRGYAGQLASGVVRTGDEVVVLPSGKRTTVAGIDLLGRPVDVAAAPQSLTLRLTDDLDVSRGDLIAAAAEAPIPTQDLEATVCWLADTPLRPGRRLLVKHGTRTVRAIVRAVHDRLDVGRPSRVDTAELTLNEIGRITVRTAEPLPIDDYAAHRRTGSFLLIDDADGTTLAAGMAGDPLPAVEGRCSAA